MLNMYVSTVYKIDMFVFSEILIYIGFIGMRN